LEEGNPFTLFPIMHQEAALTVGKVIDPPAAPEVLVEDAGKAAQNLWWDDRDESLWWTDVAGGCLYRLNFQTRIQSIIYEGPTVGAFLPQADGTWLLFREKDIALLDFDRHAQVTPLIENVRVDGDRFNEIIADSQGGILVGTVRPGRPNGAGIYRLGETGTLAKALGGTGESAGMGWNARGDVLYWTCGTTKTISRCRYDVRRGTLTNRQVFHECMPDEGTPSGLAMDIDGTLWSARRDAGVILKIGENRRLMGQITFPARHVTSLAFGGPDHHLVFAACIVDEGLSKIFLLKSPVAGMPLHRSRIETKLQHATSTARLPAL
jgi:sugar lactone lactonase YvrE